MRDEEFASALDELLALGGVALVQQLELAVAHGRPERNSLPRHIVRLSRDGVECDFEDRLDVLRQFVVVQFCDATQTLICVLLHFVVGRHTRLTDHRHHIVSLRIHLEVFVGELECIGQCLGGRKLHTQLTLVHTHPRHNSSEDLVGFALETVCLQNRDLLTHVTKRVQRCFFPLHPCWPGFWLHNQLQQQRHKLLPGAPPLIVQLGELDGCDLGDNLRGGKAHVALCGAQRGNAVVLDRCADVRVEIHPIIRQLHRLRMVLRRHEVLQRETCQCPCLHRRSSFIRELIAQQPEMVCWIPSKGQLELLLGSISCPSIWVLSCGEDLPQLCSVHRGKGVRRVVQLK
mmetsp:Transcript_71782/g.149925  ORF Transcript_71782/g.149925 Transcript_71782/m.149925 type:complete len:345 (-) Transcript_71782:58-1092(-)